MSVFGLVFLLIVGLALILVEALLVPGVSFVGAAGGLIALTGVGLTFWHYGSLAGWAVLLGFLVLTGLITWLGYRSGLWRRFALNTTLKGGVNEVETISAAWQIGEEGRTVSDLRPAGKAIFGERLTEVHTLSGAWLEAGAPVRIAKIVGSRILVEAVS